MNLLSKLHKNSILTGPVESYCLACGCLLRSEEDSYAHIHESKHAEKLKSLPLLDNYKQDCIIKIKEGYFCPFCNIVLPTIKRVSLHVTEAKHRDNKYSQSLTRDIGTIIAFDEVVIADRSWHGLDGSTCFICNEDYDDEEHHKTEATHVLNLIQSKCELGDKFVYRRVDEDLFFCLICNDILPISDKAIHHDSVTHLDLYEKSKKEATEIRDKNTTVNELNNNKADPPQPAIGDKQIIKDTGDNKPKIQDDKAYNGSAHIIKNNNCETHKETQPTVLETKNDKNTVTSPTNIDKNKNVKETVLKHENSLQDIQQNTQKVQELKIDAQNNKAQETKQTNTDKVQTEAKRIVRTEGQPIVQTEAKPIVQTEANPTVKTKIDEILPKAHEPKKSEIPKESKTKKQEPNKNQVTSEDLDSYLYEHFKSLNFLIKTGRDASYCSLCEIIIPDYETISHESDNHHRLIYAMHMKRNNAKRNVNGINKPSDTNNKPKVDSSKTNDLTEKTLANEPKATETKPQILTDKKAEQKRSNENNSKVDKENTVPDNTNKTSETRNSSVDRKDNDSLVKTDLTMSQKAIRKAQKKAHKAKLAETRAQKRENLQLPIETEASIKNLKEEISKIAQVNDANLVAKQNISNKEHIEKEITSDGKINGSMAYISDTPLKTERLVDILKTASQVDSTPEDVVINGKYVLENLSFVLILKTGGQTECVACGETLTVDGVPGHISTDEHRTNVEDCLVVTSLADEFIRQVKSQAYHCGYCNILLRSTTELESHLQSYCHGDAKTSAMWRLQRYQPALALQPTREVRQLLAAIFRCTH